MPNLENRPEDVVFGPIEREMVNRLQERTEIEEHEEMPPLPINGLLYPVDMEDRRVIEAFKFVVARVAAAAGGVEPTMRTLMVENPHNGSLVPRMMVSFEVNRLTREQLEQLEEVARRAYGEDVCGLKTSQGKTAATHLYPKIDARGREKPTLETTIGWYLGDDSGTPNRTYTGIFVYRKIGKKDIASGLKAREDGEWFTQETLYDNSGKEYTGGTYLVEIREGGMFNGPSGKVMGGPYQTDLAETIAYVSLVLAGKELPPERPGIV